MPIQKSAFAIKGMTRDLAASKFSSEYAYENKNLRVIATDDNTSFGLVNEKGTASTGVDVEGTPIGQEVINDTLVLFTTAGSGDQTMVINESGGTSLVLPDSSGYVVIEIGHNYGDHIYKFNINSSGNLEGRTLYAGDLGFSTEHPIESISVYENEKIQKVYWTDGKNQPRVINIVEANPTWNNYSFDFVKPVSYGGSITITKNEISMGLFAPGVIQYCFTYYDLYGTETNIFYTSPLYYVSYSTRGASPDDTVSCSFNIRVASGTYSTDFDYLRIYSVLRTSIDATPQVRRVVDISLRGASGDINYTDTGVGGASIDPAELLYIGGEEILAGTMSHKDNTLFLGDITMERKPIGNNIKNACRNISVTTSSKTLLLPDNGDVGNYSYTTQLNKNNEEITYYRRGEVYRVGLQAQHYTGKWSDVAYITDYLVTTPITEVGSNKRVNNLAATVPANITSALLNDGYIKIRPVVVFPEAEDRNIICEGVVCPTVYNVEDRYTNSPFAQASWFFRPNAYSLADINDAGVESKYGKHAVFSHNRPIPANNQSNSEIQCISNAPAYPLLGWINSSGYTEAVDSSAWVSQNKECYYVDQSIFTLNSPDIEFDDSLKTVDSTKLKFRIVGYIPIHASYSDIDLQANTPSNYSAGKTDEVYKYKPIVATGFVKTQVSITTETPQYGWRSLLSGAMWFDDFANSINPHLAAPLPVGFVVYPWNKSGSLNGGASNASSSILQHKKMSIFRFSKDTRMFPGAEYNSGFWTKNITGTIKFDSDEVSMVKIPGQSSGGDVYYGNIDKLIVHHNKPKGDLAIRDYNPSDGAFSIDSEETVSIVFSGAYPITIADNGVSSQDKHPLLAPFSSTNSINDEIQEITNVRIIDDDKIARNNPYQYLDYCTVDGTEYRYYRYIFDDTKTTSTDPVSMKYKSTPHLVISLANNGTRQVILPTHSSEMDRTASYDTNTFWGNITGVDQDVLTVSNFEHAGYLWLGEVYRDDITSATRYGGTSDEALENNKWIPAGEPVDITDGAEVNIVWSQGDTYYQRYDCLKTYPFTMDDINSVSDTLSFMCETRVNIDGRYDRNRGQLSNLYATPTNRNLINPVYSQQNNFFSYRGLNPNKITGTYFPNTITWTKTKTMGEIVDTWTNITLASILDVDGDKGKVRALRRFNNDILSFQDRGISQVLYNESVQISATSGVPIEIANSGKVSGKRYISNHIGCVNKWSICSAPSGIYFMDDIGKDIYLFDGKLNNISDRFGFHSWVIQNFPDIKIWNPENFSSGSEITYYDKVNGDVLFITGNTCLAFSEPLANFSSFYSYEGTPYFAMLKDRGVLWHTDNRETNGRYKAWWHREGDYNDFYGVYNPFYTVVVANEHPTEDKIFNNLEYRGDTFNPNDNSYLYLNTFDKLETWNEYQRGVANLADIKDKPSNLKKKFRIWRANIPRNTTNQGGNATHRYTRDRMRNPWLYIKLSKETPNSNKTILHDLVVHYFE